MRKRMSRRASNFHRKFSSCSLMRIIIDRWSNFWEYREHRDIKCILSFVENQRRGSFSEMEARRYVAFLSSTGTLQVSLPLPRDCPVDENRRIVQLHYGLVSTIQCQNNVIKGYTCFFLKCFPFYIKRHLYK